METTYTWENEDGATRMTLRNRGGVQDAQPLLVGDPEAFALHVSDEL